MVTISSTSRKLPNLRWNLITLITAIAILISLVNLVHGIILFRKRDSDEIQHVIREDIRSSSPRGNGSTAKLTSKNGNAQETTSNTDEALQHAKDIGVILPDGTVTFTPEEFLAGRLENYVNLPNHPAEPETDDYVKYLMEQTVPPPTEIVMHEALTPPGKNAIVGLASYKEFMNGWRKLVGSLRMNGYDGHIIVGVNKDIPKNERVYLDKMGVTYYAIETSNCTEAILDGASSTSNSVRSVCSKGLEDLKLEWGRYEMARRWLNACESCTGWSMVIDTRDIFFQADPFRSLGDPDKAEHDLLFVEEIATHTNTLPDQPHRVKNLGSSPRYTAHVNPCYGKDNVDAASLLERPMLCSGTVIGNKSGIHRFLSKLVDEFHKNNERGSQCRSPATTDQWTMNYLYYKGEFGFISRTKTLPWGTGPVLTVGTPCVNSLIPTPNHSQKDMIQFDEDGLIVNPHEEKGAVDRVAPTLHQWDRCHKWIHPWFFRHKNLFMTAFKPDDEPAMHWIADGN